LTKNPFAGETETVLVSGPKRKKGVRRQKAQLGAEE